MSYFFYKIVDLICKTGIVKLLQSNIKTLRLQKYELESPKIKKNINILFLSDFHLEVVNNIDEIKEEIKDLNYDYVVLGGDYLDNSKFFSDKKNELLDLLEIFKEKPITVKGNHDGFKVENILKDNSCYLNNTKKDFENISFYGVDDYVSNSSIKDFNKIDESKFNILISHTPDFIDEVSNKYDLMLSGHTHGGQVLFFNKAFVVNCRKKFRLYGLWEEKGVSCITTSGIGCSQHPIRKGISPEIVFIEIKKS